MDLVARIVILLLAFEWNLVQAKADKNKKLLDEHVKGLRSRKIEDNVGYPNRRRTQLYSRNSGHFVQVTLEGKVIAKGSDGNKFADLEILTVSFGKVHIRALETALYICFDKRKRLIAKKRPTPRCVFREQHGKDAYSMYESEEITGKFLAFSRKGIHRFRADSKVGTHAVQFVERPRSELIRKRARYYTSDDGRGTITPGMLDSHKRLAERMGLLHLLYSQNNPRLNPLHDGTKIKKSHRRLRKYKKKHSSRKSNEKKGDKETRNKSRFLPTNRAGKGTQGTE